MKGYLKGWKAKVKYLNSLNDAETNEHLERVGHYAEIIGTEIGCSEEFVEKMREYAALHDIGKIGISKMTLEKREKLSPGEFEELKRHVEIGSNIINRMELEEMAHNIVFHHHEKWDGSGYPAQISGEEIPLEARIMAVCDVYDALRQRRSYKNEFSHEEARRIILDGKGKAFDPELIEVFEKNHGKFHRVYEKLNTAKQGKSCDAKLKGL